MWVDVFADACVSACGVWVGLRVWVCVSVSACWSMYLSPCAVCVGLCVSLCDVCVLVDALRGCVCLCVYRV